MQYFLSHGFDDMYGYDLLFTDMSSYDSPVIRGIRDFAADVYTGCLEYGSVYAL